MPNPATNQIAIDGTSIGTTIRIMDLQGRILLQRKAGHQREILKLGKLKPGVYIVSMHSPNGTSQTERLIIH
ncbi:T9SS type A sorting domain-containing protein [Neolewinella agarilytica]|uniref:T9SS type A sorting domain-containing protein n=1 Tax=Neolewinella agarilytica TaxID=478744 RepID=UPI00387328E7